MFKKLLLISSALLLLVFCLAVIPVLAKSDNAQEPYSPPQRDGVYDVPGHPGLRVRVFVHNPHQGGGSGKPSPSPIPPTIVCPADPGSNAVTPAAGWHLPSNWTYNLNAGSAPSGVGSANLATIANNAFSQWTGALGGKVTITRGADTNVDKSQLDGLNVVAWGRTQGTALAVTSTWYYPATGEVAEVDTIFNKKFAWYWNAGDPACTDANSYDAQDILTHELGHWMGLDDTYDSSFANNTMYGYGDKGETKKDTLTNGDVLGLLAIYP